MSTAFADGGLIRPVDRQGTLAVILLETGDARADARSRASILQQSRKPDAVWLVPGADGRMPAAAAFPGVESVHRAELAIGVAETVNEILRSSDFEYTAIQDGSGSWHPSFLDRAVEFLEGRAGHAAVCATRAITIERRVHGELIEFSDERLPNPDAANKVDLSFADQLQASRTPFLSTVFRRTVAVDAGGLDPELHFATDWDLGLRMMSYGPIGTIPDSPVPLTRVHLPFDEDTRASGLPDTTERHRVAQEELLAKAIRGDRTGSTVGTAMLAFRNISEGSGNTGYISYRVDRLEGIMHGRSNVWVGMESMLGPYLRSIPRRVYRSLLSSGRRNVS